MTDATVTIPKTEYDLMKRRLSRLDALEVGRVDKWEWYGDWIKTLDALDVRYTFSINCHSGIANFVEQGHVCGCRRCREQRGEEWTEETEAQAAIDSAIAKKRFREWATKGLTK